MSENEKKGDEQDQTPRVKPEMGKFVKYVPVLNSIENNNGAEVVPAIVVSVHPEEDFRNLEVNLRCFTDGEAVSHQKLVPYDETKQPNTWHW